MKIKIGNKEFTVTKEQLESEEITLDFEGTLRTTEEEATFIENHKKEARIEGLEKAIRTKADELGLNVEGSKRKLDDVLKAYEAKILEDAKIEPTEKLKKVQQTLQEKEQALQSALAKVSEKEKEFSTYKNQSKLDKELDGLIPDNTVLPREDIKLILKNKLSFDFDESGNILALDSSGNVIKDTTTANPLGAKDVIGSFFRDNQSYLKPIEGGAGGSDSAGKGKKQSMDDFIQAQRDKNISPNSPEFNEAVTSAIKAGTLDMD